MNVYSHQWKLQVNLEKTKTLTFNKKNETVDNPKFKYNNEIIQTTNKYTYLGIEFDSTGTFKTANETLFLKGLKALYKLQSLIDNSIDIKTIMHIFDHTIKPILLYASEVWGTSFIKTKHFDDKDNIIRDIDNNYKANQLELKFYKQILKVKHNTSNIGVRGELGRHPISIYALSNSLKYLCST